MEQDKNEERELLEKLKISPDNLDLLNEVAIFYLEHPQLSQDCRERDYFEKAYNKEKTIKSTHNLAYYLFFEDWREEDKATEIQKECIALKPKSALPYELYAFFMLEKDNYKEAIKYYLLALEKGANNHHVIHNLGIAYYHQNDFKKAIEYLEYSIELAKCSDLPLYNLAIAYLSLGSKEKTTTLLKKLIEDTGDKFCDDIDYLNISTIYFFLGNYKKSSNLSVKCGGNFDFISYKEIAYSLFIADTEVYYKKFNDFIKENENTIIEIKNNTDGWEKETTKEKDISSKDAKNNILKYKKITEEFKENPPKSNLSDHIISTVCKCLLFGCETHGNQHND